MHVHQVPHKMAKFEVLSRRRHTVLSAYPIHRSANEVNRSGADAQVVFFCIIILSSFHRLSMVVHPFVEELTVFRTSG